MASTALGRGRTERGESVSFLIGTRLAVMRVSPWTLRPFCRVAIRDTLEMVEGKMRPDGQDFAADANGFGEIAGYVREGGEKEVAKIVADEAAASVKTILEEATKQSFVL